MVTVPFFYIVEWEVLKIEKINRKKVSNQEKGNVLTLEGLKQFASYGINLILDYLEKLPDDIKTELKCKLDKTGGVIDGDLDVKGNITKNGEEILTYEEIMLKSKPIGSIEINTSGINPSTYIGGTWIAWGSGKVPVGIDTSQSEFNSVEKIGGEKTHTLTENEMPSHQGHMFDNNTIWCPDSDNPDNSYYIDVNHNNGLFQKYRGRPWQILAGNELSMRGFDKGNSQSHNNLQPYITCYMWKRTA